MKVVGLVSGGKDSCYAMMKCIEYGHQIVALANLMPLDDSIDELDSYMYQTVGHQIVVSYAECMGLPLFRRRIHGSTRHQNLSYKMTQGDEVEDMLILLTEVKKQIPSVTAVSSGAIASDYQRLRVESVCSRLGLVSLAYLWKQDQSLLLQEMITKEIVAITVKVAAMGLTPAKHLGKEIAYLQHQLHSLKELYGINVCGEGGEYETLTLDCPLFENARIVLDEFQVVLHSSDSIAPVGVLHPSAFHLDYKRESASLSNNSRNDASPNGRGSVFEVHEVHVSNSEAKCPSQDLVSELTPDMGVELHLSKTKGENTFSMGCWIHDPREILNGLQKDLASILKKMESELIKDGFGWMDVLYVHLYIANMHEFAIANETYINFITEDKCQFGVPSRSTIELPLKEVGLGRAYVEILVANDQSKRVLHVQSISCWAPSCIGPYSQATLHKGILYMAGQLGLDPPTMQLCCGGATAELEQSLQNCEAVAQSFQCSLASSSILLVIYCSASLTTSQRTEIQGQFEAFLKQRRVFDDDGDESKLFDPVLLYVLAPDLPKSALVEVKPTLSIQEDMNVESGTAAWKSSCIRTPNHWGFENLPCIDSFCQKYVIHGKICVFVVSIMNEIAAQICSESVEARSHENCQYFCTQKHMNRISRFCIYLLDKFLLENNFSWGDITSLRFYFPTSLNIPWGMMSSVFREAFEEFAELSERIEMVKEGMYNLIPVAGAGKSALRMDDLITCELFASKL